MGHDINIGTHHTALFAPDCSPTPQYGSIPHSTNLSETYFEPRVRCGNSCCIDLKEISTTKKFSKISTCCWHMMGVISAVTHVGLTATSKRLGGICTNEDLTTVIAATGLSSLFFNGITFVRSTCHIIDTKYHIYSACYSFSLLAFTLISMGLVSNYLPCDNS